MPANEVFKMLKEEGINKEVIYLFFLIRNNTFIENNMKEYTGANKKQAPKNHPQKLEERLPIQMNKTKLIIIKGPSHIIPQRQNKEFIDHIVIKEAVLVEKNVLLI